MLEALPALQRVVVPRAARDVLVQVVVAGGEDVEARALLVGDDDRVRVGELLAEPGSIMAVSSGRPHMFAVYQRGRGHEPVTVAGSIRSFVAVSIVVHRLQVADPVSGSYARGYAPARRQPSALESTALR